MCGGDASPYDLPERESARRASVIGKAGRCQLRPGSSWTFPSEHQVFVGTVPHYAGLCVRKMLEMCYISIRLLDKICKMDYIFL